MHTHERIYVYVCLYTQNRGTAASEAMLLYNILARADAAAAVVAMIRWFVLLACLLARFYAELNDAADRSRV